MGFKTSGAAKGDFAMKLLGIMMVGLLVFTFTALQEVGADQVLNYSTPKKGRKLTIMTPEQLAMRVLREFYKEKHVGEGFLGLNLRNFVHPGWTKEDLEVGLNYCSVKGWLTKDEWLLTDKGEEFAKSERVKS